MGSYGESYPIERAIQSGQFAKVIAKIEQNGIPVDMATFRELEQYLPKIKPTLAKIANEEFPVWEEETKSNKWVFKQKKLKEYAESQGITDWATTPSGRLKTETEYLEEDLLVRYPHLEGFVRTYLLMQSVKNFKVQVGRDGRARTGMKPYGTKTGRCQPSSNQYLFAIDKTFRRLIQPEADKAIGYFDYSGEEIAIAAGLSGDQAMQKAYQAGAVPADATKESHGFERSQYKVVALAVQYGGGAPNVASRLGISEDAARKLLDDHKRAFPDFNRWSWSLTERLGVMSSADGWTYRISRKGSKQTKSTTLKNFPMQAGGVDILRRACIALDEAGFKLIGTVHDAVAIGFDDTPDLQEKVEEVRQIMRRCGASIFDSKKVSEGFEIRVDVQLVRHPDTFAESSTDALWSKIQNAIETVKAVEGQ
jgi:DNA polymerase I-like protein with 3'-5' exonuclease and polymerase domains